jgi:hypothetical protein
VLDSHFHYDASNYRRPLDQVPVTDFFGSVSSIRPTPALNSTAGDADTGSNSSRDTLQLGTAAEGGSTGVARRSSESSSSSEALSCRQESVAVAVGPVEASPGGIVATQVYAGMGAVLCMVVAASVASARVLAPQTS